ncbi:minor tail protein [Arthrobacter phage Kuleana]|uniref:Minor tail protein n=1 Tax=Arthrobacter phage Kuleana TaxID=2653270 RepID=A0A5Q2W8S3_9CAUD|nr:minor tail protein [Arthrobacter phage Kuleana]QGH74507.1 minor tail protein [Arthrobacter phage Kuleana]
MPIQTRNKTTVPVNSDPYALTADIKTAIEGLNTPIPVADQAERDALPSPFEGMKVVRLDIGGMEETYIGGAWTPTKIDITTFATGITAVAGEGHKPRLIRSAGMVHMLGAISLGAGGATNNFFTVPDGFRPSVGGTIFIGAGFTQNSVGFELVVANNIVSALYFTDSVAVGSFFPLASKWEVV